MNPSEPIGRGAATRAALIDAATAVFARSGYDAASVTEIVEIADSSVGSLYHHFGGKADLWLAVYDKHQLALQQRTSARFRAALTDGDQDALTLFVLGSRAYLEACWQERKLVRLFARGDQPPGFGMTTRAKFEQWVAHNTDQLDERSNPLSGNLVLALTTLARTAGIEVASQPSRAKANTVIEEFLDIMLRLYPR